MGTTMGDGGWEPYALDVLGGSTSCAVLLHKVDNTGFTHTGLNC